MPSQLKYVLAASATFLLSACAKQDYDQRSAAYNRDFRKKAEAGDVRAMDALAVKRLSEAYAAAAEALEWAQLATAKGGKHSRETTKKAEAMCELYLR